MQSQDKTATLTQLDEVLRTLCAERKAGVVLTSAEKYMDDHGPTLRAALADAERLSFIEDAANSGTTLSLVSDDNGHWAVSDSGFNPVSELPDDMMIGVFVAKADWCDSPRAAIDHAIAASKEGSNEV